MLLRFPHACFFASLLLPCLRRTDKEADDIPLLNVKAAVLKKVVEYMRYHAENPPKDIEKPLKSPNMAEVVSQWDAEFVDVDQELLFELILAANYMDIKPLLDLSCAKVRHLIRLSCALAISAVPSPPCRILIPHFFLFPPLRCYCLCVVVFRLPL